MRRRVLITGATSGIGEATSELLASQGFSLILCGRRAERLEKLKIKLSTLTEIKILRFDIRNHEDVNEAFNSLPAEWQEIDILINNAGNAHGLDPIQNGNVDDWDAMMDINVKGLLYISRVVLPGMVNRKSGHVINIGSIAGKEVYPEGNVYCASKFAVDALSQGMRIDLNEYNIKVTALHPGLVDTEFSKVRFKGDELKARNVYRGMKPLTASDIAETIFFIISRPSHVTIADIVVLPTAQASVGRIKRVD
jgi:3-hydroxy acid dehydrogenase / malonic semialdehyde reductase